MIKYWSWKTFPGSKLHLNFKKLKGNTLAEFKNVFFSYKTRKTTVLKNINLKINEGDKIFLYGDSGSGKSTFIDIFLGFLKSTCGEIIINPEKS